MFRILIVAESQNQMRKIDVIAVTLNQVSHIISTDQQG
jgi:hypothetical protein